MANFTRKHYKAIAEVIMQAEPRLCSRTLEHNLALAAQDSLEAVGVLQMEARPQYYLIG